MKGIAKRILSAFLVASMIFSHATVAPVFAEDESETVTEVREVKESPKPAETNEEVKKETESIEEKTEEAEKAEESEKTEESETTEGSEENSSEESEEEEEGEESEDGEETEEEEEEIVGELITLTKTLSNRIIEVTFDSAILPEGVNLVVKKASEAQKEEFDAQMPEELVTMDAVDIGFVDPDGNEVEPNGKVKVKITYNKALSPENEDGIIVGKNTVYSNEEGEAVFTVIDEASEVDWNLHHIKDSGAIEDLTSKANMNVTETQQLQSVEFKSNSFSIYVVSDTGTQTVTNDIETALRNALQDGKTVVLNQDVAIHSRIEIKKTAKLYLNGYNIDLSAYNTGDWTPFTIYQGGNLTVQNNYPQIDSDKHEGVISGSPKGVFKVENGSKLTVEDISVNNNKTSGKGAAITTNEGQGVSNISVTVKSSTFSGNHANEEGGAIYVTGSGTTLNISGCKFTGNSAGTGGAVSAGAYWPTYNTKVNVGGNTIFTGNSSSTGEGGAFRIGDGNRAVITSATFTDNHCNDHNNWGGGAIFVAQTGYLELNCPVIRNNTAGGFGGGLAGCPTGRVFSFAGAAVFDNSATKYGDTPHLSGGNSTKPQDHVANESDVFRQGETNDVFCALRGEVSSYMLGGGTANWTGSINGVAINPDDFKDKNFVSGGSTIGLTAHPSSADKAAANAAAKVVIANNSSYTHGGGIMCNGYIFLRNPEEPLEEPQEVYDALVLTANKFVRHESDPSKNVEYDQNANPFVFELLDKDMKLVRTINSKNPSSKNGNTVVYDKTKGTVSLFIQMDKAHIDTNASGNITSTYYLRETGSTKGIIYDNSVHKITINWGKTSETVPVNETTNLHIDRYVIKSAKVTKGNETLASMTDNDWSTCGGDHYHDLVYGGANGFINTLFDTSKLNVIKVAVDDENNTISTTRTFKVQIKGQDGKYYSPDGDVVTANDFYNVTTTTHLTFENLPIQKYTVIEDTGAVAIDNYQYLSKGSTTTTTVTTDKNETKSATITNKYAEKTSIPVTKTWKDDDNNDGKRPASITVNLLADSKKVAEKTVTKDDNWSWTFTGLDKYNANGDVIKYEITENEVTDYTTEVKGYEVINTHNKEKTSIDGSKTWVDDNNNDGKRPRQIVINLLADGDKVDSTTVIPDSDGNWTWSFNDLDKYKNGKEIVYTFTEEKVAEYTTEVNGTEIINTHTNEKTSILGTKTWEDDNNNDGKRPTKITVNLINKNSNKVVDTKEVSEDANGQWKYSFTDLPKYDKGVEIVYAISEPTVAEYTTSYNGNDIINTHTNELTEISGSKTWKDDDDNDGKRPESITINLLADGVKVDSKVVTEEDEWKWTFDGLEKYKAGKEIVYTFTEDEVKDYTTEVNGTEVINTHNKELTYISGTKTWNDEDNKDGSRPTSITVNLLADGVKVASKVVTKDDRWGWSFDNLEKYKAGKEIKYTFTEDVVKGYETEIDGTEIINTHESVKVKVSKLDALTDEELDGAHFELYQGEELITEWDSEGEPKVIEGLQVNTEYRLVETVAPLGYTITDEVTFTIDEENKVTTTAEQTTDEDGKPVILVKDNQTQTDVIKVDGLNDQPLAGAVLQIIDPEGTVVYTWTSTLETEVIKKLQTNVLYTIKEVKAPKGYKVGKATKFMLNEDGTINMEQTTAEVIDGQIVITNNRVKPDTRGDDPDGDGDSDLKTGDDTNIRGYLSMLLVSMLGLLYGLFTFFRRREIQE